MQGNSSQINSSQTGVHSGLPEVLRSHFHHAFNKPVSQHTADVFGNLADAVHRQAVRGFILDSGCGTGASTFAIARQHSDQLVIGIDKSAKRLQTKINERTDNCILLRAEAGDFWRLANRANWRAKKHYLLYPNPWPKPRHLQRRWHGSALFPQLLQLGGELELRCNWETYALEFQQALAYAGIKSLLKEIPANGYAARAGQEQVAEPISPFEAKYLASGHKLWILTANLTNAVYPTTDRQ